VISPRHHQYVWQWSEWPSSIPAASTIALLDQSDQCPISTQCRHRNEQKTNEQTDKTLVQAFVSSRLDYCNCLLIGLMRRLQAVQNATARLITGTRRRDHITPILRQLHWLPVRKRAEFKLAMLVFKSLRGLAQQYLVDDCQLVTASGRRQQRSSNAST